MRYYRANVFLPGCLGPVARGVALEGDVEAQIAALREELAEWKTRAGRRTNDMGELSNEKLELRQRLADAERRNAELTGVLRDIANGNASSLTVIKSMVAAVLNHKPQAASHDTSIIGIERMPPMEYDEP